MCLLGRSEVSLKNLALNRARCLRAAGQAGSTAQPTCLLYLAACSSGACSFSVLPQHHLAGAGADSVREGPGLRPAPFR